jgi:uncharacterized protein (TIGR02453 family)
MTFRGFENDAFDFYARLEADNSKAFWLANKAIYEQHVKAPMAALLAELPEQYQPFSVFRPNRDVRFSKDKSPYKTHIGAYSEHEGGGGYYLQLSATGLVVAGGYYQMATDQLARFRDAIDDDTTGSELAALVAKLRKSGYTTGAFEELKTAPRGYPKDHPRVELLRGKGLFASRTFEPAPWMGKAALKAKVLGVWTAIEPMCAWLDANVGPSELPPDDERWVR